MRFSTLINLILNKETLVKTIFFGIGPVGSREKACSKVSIVRNPHTLVTFEQRRADTGKIL